MAVLLTAGRLRAVLRQRGAGERLVVVPRSRAVPPTRVPHGIGWVHAQMALVDIYKKRLILV